MRWTPRKLKLLLNLYPPYLAAGIRVTHIDPEWRELHVSMKLRWYNRNAVGTHFGGSLYSMIDPHLMLLLMQLLGSDYAVWDKAASIEFRKPGRGRVRSIIRISDEDLQQISEETAKGSVYRPEFTVDILDQNDQVVARAQKVLHIRKKPVL